MTPGQPIAVLQQLKSVRRLARQKLNLHLPCPRQVRRRRRNRIGRLQRVRSRENLKETIRDDLVVARRQRVRIDRQARVSRQVLRRTASSFTSSPSRASHARAPGDVNTWFG